MTEAKQRQAGIALCRSVDGSNFEPAIDQLVSRDVEKILPYHDLEQSKIYGKIQH